MVFNTFLQRTASFSVTSKLEIVIFLEPNRCKNMATTFQKITFPSEKSGGFTHPLETELLEELMALTDFCQIRSRNSLTEFLKRIMLNIDSPLHAFVAHFDTHKCILECPTKLGLFKLDLKNLTQWIGISIEHAGEFDYIGTTGEYVSRFNRPENFEYLNLKLIRNLGSFSTQHLLNAELVAQFFTDQIHGLHFSWETSNAVAYYAKSPIDFDCFELSRVHIFEPFEQMDLESIGRIRCLIGESVLEEAIKGLYFSKEESLNELIKIAYGIKNGYIDLRGYLFARRKSVDPYFFFNIGPVIDLFLSCKTFVELYHRCSMYEWFDFIPYEKK